MKPFIISLILIAPLSKAISQTSVGEIDSLVAHLEKKVYKHHVENKSTSKSSSEITNEYFIDSLSHGLYKVIHKEARPRDELSTKDYYFVNDKLVKVEIIERGLYGCAISIRDYYFRGNALIGGTKSDAAAKDMLIKNGNNYLKHFKGLGF